MATDGFPFCNAKKVGEEMNLGVGKWPKIGAEIGDAIGNAFGDAIGNDIGGGNFVTHTNEILKLRVS